MAGSTRCSGGASRILALSPFLSILSACSATPPGEINELYRGVLLDRQQNYRVKPGDMLTISLYSPQHADLNQEDVVVLSDGRCDLFFLDDFHVGGKTVAEIESEIRTHVASEVRDPELTIHVSPKAEKVYLSGQFEKPQSVEWTPNLTLGEAIAAANSWRVTGLPSYAVLTRPYMDARFPDRFRVSLWDESEEILLLPGDRILLERNFLAATIDWIREHIFGVLGPNPLYWLTFAGAI